MSAVITDAPLHPALVAVHSAEEREFVGQVPGAAHVAWATVLRGLRFGTADVLHAFEERNAAAQSEDQHRDDEAPEVQLLAMTEWMLRCGRALTEPEPHDQEDVPATTNFVTVIAALAAIAP